MASVLSMKWLSRHEEFSYSLVARWGKLHFSFGYWKLGKQYRQRGLYLCWIGLGTTYCDASPSLRQQVMSIEDPVEIKQEDMLSCSEWWWTAYNLIKLSLRHHSLLIIGEIQDDETARAVVEPVWQGVSFNHSCQEYSECLWASGLGVVKRCSRSARSFWS